MPLRLRSPRGTRCGIPPFVFPSASRSLQARRAPSRTGLLVCRYGTRLESHLYNDFLLTEALLSGPNPAESFREKWVHEVPPMRKATGALASF